MVTDKGMIVVEEYVETKWAGNTRDRYVALGYQYTGNATQLFVKPEHLTGNSGVSVNVQCPYCHQIYRTRFQYVSSKSCTCPEYLTNHPNRTVAIAYREDKNKAITWQKINIFIKRFRYRIKKIKFPKIWSTNIRGVRLRINVNFVIEHDTFTPESHSTKIVYRGPNWEEQSSKARDRDGHVCIRCGKNKKKNGREMDVHHLIPFREFNYVAGENQNYIEANRLSNLASLCRKCHARAENNKEVNDEVIALLALREDRKDRLIHE